MSAVMPEPLYFHCRACLAEDKLWQGAEVTITGKILRISCRACALTIAEYEGIGENPWVEEMGPPRKRTH